MYKNVFTKFQNCATISRFMVQDVRLQRISIMKFIKPNTPEESRIQYLLKLKL